MIITSITICIVIIWNRVLYPIFLFVMYEEQYGRVKSQSYNLLKVNYFNNRGP